MFDSEDLREYERRLGPGPYSSGSGLFWGGLMLVVLFGILYLSDRSLLNLTLIVVGAVCIVVGFLRYMNRGVSEIEAQERWKRERGDVPWWFRLLR